LLRCTHSNIDPNTHAAVSCVIQTKGDRTRACSIGNINNEVTLRSYDRCDLKEGCRYTTGHSMNIEQSCWFYRCVSIETHLCVASATNTWKASWIHGRHHGRHHGGGDPYNAQQVYILRKMNAKPRLTLQILATYSEADASRPHLTRRSHYENNINLTTLIPNGAWWELSLLCYECRRGAMLLEMVCNTLILDRPSK
jgi:hypothetical protein